MTDEEYLVELVKYYPDRGHDLEKRLSECAMGLAGEAGETTDLLKKHLIYGRTLDREALVLEMGDVLNYLTKLSHEIGVDMAEIRRRNIAKLDARLKNSPAHYWRKE